MKGGLRILCLFLMIFLLLPSMAKAQSDTWCDSIARSVPRTISTDLPILVSYFQRYAESERALARMFFTWMTEHVSYDDEAYNKGAFKDCSAEAVWTFRKTVCAGFAELFAELCRTANMDCIVITGYSKGFRHVNGRAVLEPDHAWNAVYADGKWMLVDVTWGQGYGELSEHGLKSIKMFDPFWFDTPPDAFIFTHLPESGKEEMQFLKTPVSLSEFNCLTIHQASELLNAEVNRSRLDACRK